MQNKVLNEVAIEQMDDLIKAVKGGSTGFDADGTLPELQDGEVTDPLMAVGNDGKAKKLPVKTLFGKHNIRGSGNVDLYKHHIHITGGDISSGDDIDAYIDIYSSNNLVIDSLTDLKTYLGNDFITSAYGFNHSADGERAVVGADQDGCLYTDGLSRRVLWSVLTLADTVTTI